MCCGRIGGPREEAFRLPAGRHGGLRFRGGTRRRFVEEKIVIVAIENPDDAALADEVADPLDHLAAAMTARGISPRAGNDALARRPLEKA